MQRTETTVPFGKITSARRRTHLENAIERGYTANRGLALYESGLPTLKGKGITRIIGDKIAQGETVNVLDIGCGQGIALAGLIQRYPGVRAFGISAFDYRDKENPWKEYVNQIDYRVGDAHRLARVFPDVKFDVVVSRMCLDYTADPLSVLRQAYRRSEIGGVLLIDRFGPRLTEEQANNLQAMWGESGIQAELSRYNFASPDSPSICSLAIQKPLNDRLPLPFSYALLDEGEEKELGYYFNNEIVYTTMA